MHRSEITLHTPVSVSTPQDSADLPTATGFAFKVSQDDPDWAMAQADNITLTFKLQHLTPNADTEVQLAVPFVIDGIDGIDGECLHDMTVAYVPSAVTPEELAEAMTQAFWDHDDYPTLDDRREALIKRRTAMDDMVRASLTGTDPVLEEHLQTFANSFFTNLPNPQGPITVRSDNGRITVTYDPSQNG